MFAQISVLSLLAAAAAAQNSTTSAPSSTSTASPLIPTGISSGCSEYLDQFNTGTTLSPCLNALIAAGKSFAPGTNTPAANVTTALSTLCSPATNSTCSATAIRSALNDFQSKCSAEIGNNQNVTAIYDVLYGFSPLQTALCATNDDGSYCVAQVSKYAQSASSTPKNISYTPVAGGLTPDLSVIGAANIPFFYLNANTPSSLLCTTCTRKILAAYISWESTMPYPSGITQSPSLAGQAPLYNAVNTQCGASFLNPTLQAAGSLSGGSGDSSAALSTVADMKTVLTVALGLAATLVTFH